jgi:hypothetical protein
LRGWTKDDVEIFDCFWVNGGVNEEGSHENSLPLLRFNDLQGRKEGRAFLGTFVFALVGALIWVFSMKKRMREEQKKLI